MVGAENAELGVARLHAPLELLRGSARRRAERLDRAHLLLLSIVVPARHRADSNRRERALQARASPLGHGVARAPERSRTSAPGVEARCSSTELRRQGAGGGIEPSSSGGTAETVASAGATPARAAPPPDPSTARLRYQLLAQPVGLDEQAVHRSLVRRGGSSSARVRRRSRRSTRRSRRAPRSRFARRSNRHARDARARHRSQPPGLAELDSPCPTWHACIAHFVEAVRFDELRPLTRFCARQSSPFPLLAGPR